MQRLLSIMGQEWRYCLTAMVYSLFYVGTLAAQNTEPLYGDEVITAENLFIKDIETLEDSAPPVKQADDVKSIVDLTFGEDSEEASDEAVQQAPDVSQVEGSGDAVLESAEGFAENQVSDAITKEEQNQPLQSETVSIENELNNAKVTKELQADDKLDGESLEPDGEEVVDQPTKLKEVVGLDPSAFYDISDLKSAAASTRLTAAVFIVSNQTSTPEDRELAVKELGKLLQFGNSELRQTSMEALKILGPDAKAAVHLIEVALHRQTIGVEGIELLRRIGDRNAVEGLANLLSHKDENIEEAALAALGTIGPAAQLAVENLLRLLNDRHDPILVLDALGKIGGARAINASINLLNGDDKDIRIKAAEVLGRQGRASLRAIPALKRMASSPDPEISLAGSEALSKIRNELNF